MSNIVSSEALKKAITLAQRYLRNEDFEEGINTTILRDEESRIEIDVELRCEADLTYDSGSYLVPPSVSGTIVNKPVSIVAWFFDADWDNPTDRDITEKLQSYTYYC